MMFLLEHLGHTRPEEFRFNGLAVATWFALILEPQFGQNDVSVFVPQTLHRILVLLRYLIMLVNPTALPMIRAE